MTTPDTPEPTQPPDSAFRRITRELSGVDCGCACHTGTGYNTSCQHCQPTEAPAEGGQSTRIIPARADQPHTEAPAPAAPSADAVADWRREFIEGFAADDEERYEMDVALRNYERFIAAHVPGGAAGEALEALLGAAARSLDGVPTHGPMCDDDDDGECICWMGELRTAIAAARAPGPAGGEA